MNATSSRAHTVVTIQFDQISKNDMGQETKKTSIINLVDLAGRPRFSLNIPGVPKKVSPLEQFQKSKHCLVLNHLNP